MKTDCMFMLERGYGLLLTRFKISRKGDLFVPGFKVYLLKLASSGNPLNDPQEAATLADRVVYLSEGQLSESSTIRITARGLTASEAIGQPKRTVHHIDFVVLRAICTV